MMNPITCVCVLMAAGSGLYLFQEKQQVQMLDRQIEQVLHAADAAHARTGMLRAEYALLNDPSRLQQLARQHLPTLVNTEPTQFANLAELDRRLPTVRAPTAAEPAPPEPMATSAKLAQATPPTAAPTSASPVPAAPAPRVTAAHFAARAVAAHPAAIVATPALSLVAATPPTPARAARAAPRNLAQRTPTSRPQNNQRLAFAIRGNPYPTQPAPMVEVIQRVARVAPVDAGTPMVSSALGMARSMTAPSPPASATQAAFYSGGSQSR